jgi:aspartate-semialdehyde dehydrogenase
VIPEINAHVLSLDTKLVANPNCTTAIAAVALYPLHKRYTIKKLIMSTYQAASGSGAEGMDELVEGSKCVLAGDEAPAKVFAYPLAFNLIPHIDKFQPNGYTKEEMKVTWETLKIFGTTENEMKISCTAVRVPIKRAHSEAITLETAEPITPEGAKAILSKAVGCKLVDDVECEKPIYPMPMNATAEYDIEVGRVRTSNVFGDRGIDLFVSGDQLLRGAAWNAVLIAVEIVKLIK